MPFKDQQLLKFKTECSECWVPVSTKPARIALRGFKDSAGIAFARQSDTRAAMRPRQANAKVDQFQNLSVDVLFERLGSSGSERLSQLQYPPLSVAWHQSPEAVRQGLTFLKRLESLKTCPASVQTLLPSKSDRSLLRPQRDALDLLLSTHLKRLRGPTRTLVWHSDTTRNSSN